MASGQECCELAETRKLLSSERQEHLPGEPRRASEGVVEWSFWKSSEGVVRVNRNANFMLESMRLTDD